MKNFNFISTPISPIRLWPAVLMLIMVINVHGTDEDHLKRCSRAAIRSGSKQHQCVLTPKGMEGPYYLPLNLVRSDIREDRVGVPFFLKLTVNDARLCQPLRNVSVDIWQADAVGLYSSYLDNSIKLLRPGDRHAIPTDNTTFLRGVQFTDNNGMVQFVTIFPGPYGPRAPHIHVSIQVDGAKVYIGQIYFKHDFILRVLQLAPYKSKKDRYTKNEDDSIYVNENGVRSTVKSLVPVDGTNIANGIKGEMVLGINKCL